VVLRTAVRVALMAVATIFVGIVGAMVGIWSLSDTLAVLLRSFLVISLLLAMTRAFRVRDRSASDHAARPSQQVLAAAGLASVVNLVGWGGHSLFGQLLVPAGVFSALLDFVVWMAVAVVGVRLGDHARVQATVAAAPYA
jgi:hypothetical protein